MRIAGAIIGFAVATAFCPSMAGGATSPRWAVIALAASMLLFCQPRRAGLTTANAAALALLGWVASSALWTAFPLDAIDEIGRLVLISIAFMLGGILDQRATLYGMAVGVAISGVVAAAQLSGYAGIPQVAVPGGLFFNKNYMAEAAALVLVYAVARNERVMAALCAAATLLPATRAVLLAIGAAALSQLPARLRWVALIGAAAALPPALAIALVVTGDTSLGDRIAIWQDTFAHITLFGYGIGSFVETYPHIAAAYVRQTRPMHPHNEFLWLAFETGIVGLALAWLCIGILLARATACERAVIVVFIVEACFAFPLHNPVTAFTFALVAGRIAVRCPHLRDALARGRMALCTRLRRHRSSNSVCRA